MHYSSGLAFGRSVENVGVLETGPRVEQTCLRVADAVVVYVVRYFLFLGWG